MTRLARLPNWRERFGAFVSARHAMPFAWGANDCVLFAADAVQAITGVDMVEEFRGAYSSAGGALRVLEPLGGIAAAASGRLGVSTPGAMARVGDVCLVTMDGRHALGVCNGTEILGPGRAGMSHGPLSAALLCWRVG